jgi:hypothetical protein
MSAADPVARNANPVRKHRREVWLRIVAPVVLPFAGLIALCAVLIVAVATDKLAGKQITVLMSILATACIMLPMMILCLVPYALLALSACGTGRVYAHASGPLRSMRHLTGQIAAKTARHVPRLARPFIGLNVRITRWEHTLRGWQSLGLPARKDGGDE